MKWRIYYGDGSTYDGESFEDAYNAPAVNAVILKQEADNWRGYSLRHGTYFFCWEHIVLSDGTVLEEGRWSSKNDLFGLMDYYTYHKGPQKVLIGREIHDATYHEISRIADNDGCLCSEECEHKL